MRKRYNFLKIIFIRKDIPIMDKPHYQNTGSRNRIQFSFYLIGLMMLAFFFFLLAVPTTVLILGGRIGGWMLIVAVPASVVTVWLMTGRRLDKTFVISGLCFFILLIVTIAFYSGIYSGDYDGNTYHKMAIGLLKNGWNPIRESSSTFAEGFFPIDVHVGSIFIDHYTKGPWIYGAVVYAFTNNVESGKVYNLWALLCLFCLAFDFLQQKMGHVKAFIVSLLLCMSPVSMVQLLTYYEDGLLASFLFILVIALTQCVDKNNLHHGSQAKMSVFFAMAVLGNIKFTGLLYGGIFCIGYFILLVITEFRTQPDRIAARYNSLRNFGFFAAVAAGTVLWVGFPAYVTNVIDHKNPVFPLAGEGKVDIMTGHLPGGLEGKSIFYKLFYTIFGELSNMSGEAQELLPKLKVPFTTSREELWRCVRTPGCVDWRISGFGVFFSGLLLISIGIIIWKLIKLNKRDDLFFYAATNLILIFGLLLGISESWWARYSPYLYLLVIGALIIALHDFRLPFMKGFCGLFIALLFVNNFLFLGEGYYTLRHSPIIAHDLQDVEGRSIIVRFPNESYTGLLFNLEDRDVKYVIGEQPMSDHDVLTFYGLLQWKYNDDMQ